MDQQEGLRINYEERIRNVENVLNNWHHKSLTLIGKLIAVVNALLSRISNGLCHVVNSIASCPKFITQTNVLLFNFFWDNEVDKIKRIEIGLSRWRFEDVKHYRI